MRPPPGNAGCVLVKVSVGKVQAIAAMCGGMHAQFNDEFVAGKNRRDLK
jgi:hypothetical protein